MYPDISNTSQSLVINTYYGYTCSEKDKMMTNKKIENNFGASFMMNMMQDISKTLDTKIIHTSSHSFEPSGVSLASVIESNEPIFGASGVAHLSESHISFHSYFENSLNDIIILRLELHISSCSRKSVYFALGDISKDDKFDNFDAITLDFFHRGLDLESYEDDGNNILDAYLKEKVRTYDIVDDKRTNAFVNIKLIKHKNKLLSELMSDSLYKHLI